MLCFAVCSALEQTVPGELLAEFTESAAQITSLTDFQDIFKNMEHAFLQLKSRLSVEENNIRIVCRIKALIEDNLPQVGAAMLADQVHLSKNYLSSLFKRHTGQTLNDYITSVRLQKASELLRTHGCYIYEAADRVGYKDVAYFSKLFKQQYGCTPAEYKAEAHR